MEISKEFELYRKLEVVLFRYFKIAEFIEYMLKIKTKLKDDISVILDPKGYDNSSIKVMGVGNTFFDENIYIPFNPFYLDEDDKKVFVNMFPNKFWEIENEPQQLRKTLNSVWKRIHEMKWWLGITIDTRYCGIRRESRLVCVLENYLKSDIKEFRYDFEHAVFRNVDKRTIKKFLRVVKNRKRSKGIIWLLKK